MESKIVVATLVFLFLVFRRAEGITFLNSACVSYLLIFPAGLKCHYCGIEDLCSLPYDTLEANYITCPNSCMKFDGSADGKKVIIRGCGSQEVDVCGEEPEQYANTRAMGTLCTCMSDKCNLATGPGPSVSLILGIICLIKIWI